jgi:pimeloyl-ACP methyl ester carboxylesterase
MIESKSISKIEFIELDSGLRLRRMIVQHSHPKGVVVFLHGFPETLISWKEISLVLSNDYEIHAFDWPGYGCSTRPSLDKFSYSPRDYSHVLREYIKKSGIDSSKLLIYATDIGSLPALLLALEEPALVKKMIVGDFAPFDRSQYMHQNLQSLKSPTGADQIRAHMNKNYDDILENCYRRGLSTNEQFEISKELKDDMRSGWNQTDITSADAFYYYYANFTRDQNYFEANVSKINASINVIWGEKDFYIKKEMGMEFAKKLNLELKVLSGIGHYPHLQDLKQTIKEIYSSFN